MKKYLNLDTWPRRPHFNFYRQFDEPFFGVTVDVDCTNAYRRCKDEKYSFFLYYLHKSISAINGIEEFRYRIDGEQVLIHDRIDASSTINREDGTFGFSYIKFEKDFDAFVALADKEISRVRANHDLVPAKEVDHVVHYPSLPWVKFTSFSHARHFKFSESVPKISFGKMTNDNGRRMMPVSIHVHHALVDGYHVGQHVELFQTLLDEG